MTAVTDGDRGLQVAATLDSLPMTSTAGSVAAAQRGPLDGLRVLDLGTRIGAPFCAGLLGEWGADVVKVEQPGVGDFMRTIGPFAPEHPGTVPAETDLATRCSGPSKAGAGEV